jgi:hypothetical protein
LVELNYFSLFFGGSFVRYSSTVVCRLVVHLGVVTTLSDLGVVARGLVVDEQRQGHRGELRESEPTPERRAQLGEERAKCDRQKERKRNK